MNKLDNFIEKNPLLALIAAAAIIVTTGALFGNPIVISMAAILWTGFAIGFMNRK